MFEFVAPYWALLAPLPWLLRRLLPPRSADEAALRVPTLDPFSAFLERHGHGDARRRLRLAALWALDDQFLLQLGLFFSKLAVVTFGGAYAVLAYISQTVVSQFGWITAGQMIDALGLAETTPGPLILVTQFVAMLSGLTQGGSGLFLAAGAVALWATFMPCFLWIFAAAPYVERIAAHPRLGMALKAVTATVAGVILNLSVWFMMHVGFAGTQVFEAGILHMPVPIWSSMNSTAVLLVLLAPFAAWMVRGNMLLLLAVMAAAGLAVAEFPFAIS